MTYQSPLHILKGIAEKDFEINETNLIRLRKRLLADLNLSGKTSIDVNGKSFSKDEIIKIVDQLLSNTDLDLHEFIYKHKGLLNYLEKEDTYSTYDGCYRLYAKSPVEEKIALLLEERFMLQLRKAISKKNFVYAKESLLFIAQVKEARKSFYYDEVHKQLSHLTTFNNEVIALIQKGERLPKEIIEGDHFKFLGDKNLAPFLNALPEAFDDSIDNFQASVINLMFYYHKKNGYDKKLVADMSYMLIAIRDCNPEHTSIIQKNHKAYTASDSDSSSPFNFNGAALGFGLIILIRILMGLSTCKKHDKIHQEYRPIRYITPERKTAMVAQYLHLK